MAREPANWLDQLLSGTRGAVEDIRAKLIDEAWFGHGDSAPARPAPDLGWTNDAGPRSQEEICPRASFAEAWATRDAPTVGAELGQDREFER